eukprot:XP_011675246.1 PREDICTED: uncharacterized protein LOC105443598 [Strongylocentrotus purpuratus]
MKWKVMQQPPHSNNRQLLADALREIDLGGLSDRLLNEPLFPISTGGPSRLLESQTKPPSAVSRNKPFSPELVKQRAKVFKSSTVSEKEFLKLAKAIPPSYYDAVGISLGIPSTQIQAILIQMLNNYTDAFLHVFLKWNVKQQHLNSNRRQLLADALREIDLGGLSDRLLNEPLFPISTGGPSRLNESLTTPPSAESQTKPLSPELVEWCANDFKSKYRSTVCKIRADPFNPASIGLYMNRGDSEDQIDFIVDVAFESQDPDVAALVKDRVSSEELTISWDTSAHTVAGYAYIGSHVIVSVNSRI